jgi:hypothetical protein
MYADVALKKVAIKGCPETESCNAVREATDHRDPGGGPSALVMTSACPHCSHDLRGNSASSVRNPWTENLEFAHRQGEWDNPLVRRSTFRLGFVR